jgi:RNA polymerase sigma-70 factor (ECF subfamily)
MPTFLLDVADAERRFAQEPSRSEDELFARRWALTVLENTLTGLHAEYQEEEKGDLFRALKPFLGFNKGDDAPYASAALEIGMSSSAFHLAAYNFRIRYRELLREIVAETVRFSEDVDSELTVLLVGAS